MKKSKQETLDSLTTIVKAFYNPLEKFEGVSTHAGHLHQKFNPSKQNQLSVQQSELASISPLQGKEDKEPTKRQRVKNAFLNLGNLFTVCQNCGMRVLKDELVSGICFNCHNQEELHDVEKDVLRSKSNEQIIQLFGRIGELEAQVNSLQLVQEKNSSNTNSVIFNPAKIPFPPFNPPKTQSKGVSPPPPPPPLPVITDFIDITNLANMTFSKLTLEELSSFTTEILSKLSLQQRNQYTARLKELKLIEQMTPEEKTAYLRKREQVNQHSVDRQSVIASLDDSSSPLFKKMREQAEKSSLVGKGTLGVLESKEIFVHCYKCNNSNKIIEGEEAICTSCNSPLNTR